MEGNFPVVFAVVVDNYNPPPKVFQKYMGRARLLEYLANLHPVGVVLGLVFSMLDGQELGRKYQQTRFLLYCFESPFLLLEVLVTSYNPPASTRDLKLNTQHLEAIRHG
jgi:hypothetical protein